MKLTATERKLLLEYAKWIGEAAEQIKTEARPTSRECDVEMLEACHDQLTQNIEGLAKFLEENCYTEDGNVK